MSSGNSPSSETPPALVVSRYVLSDEPEGAEDVIQVRESAADEQDVVVFGRIGGTADPWIDGRAAFWIVDKSLRACSDIPGDSCPKPWDYCCETDKLPTAIALVKFVDDDGALLEYDARDFLGVKELSKVVVKGKASRDDAGNLTVLASGVYVRE